MDVDLSSLRHLEIPAVVIILAFGNALHPDLAVNPCP
jgi:hypothetical protein